LSSKQNYAKFLDDVKKGKYRLLITSESKMDEVLKASWKTNSDLIEVAEKLKNDFPDLECQISRLLFILDSVEK